jgi:hypothetical protein
MLQTLKLLFPALVPSWNFFDVIADSPRIEYVELPSPTAPAEAWREFRPRPARLSPAAMLSRLFWNARWNESLFLVSCAERLLAEPDAHSRDEIFRRIAADLAERREAGPGWLRFRIVLVGEREEGIARKIAYLSDPRALASIPVR